MSGGLAPARRAKTAKSIEHGADETGRPHVRVGYALALVWIVIASLLYAVEVLKLVSGLG